MILIYTEDIYREGRRCVNFSQYDRLIVREVSRFTIHDDTAFRAEAIEHSDRFFAVVAERTTTTGVDYEILALANSEDSVIEKYKNATRALRNAICYAKSGVCYCNVDSSAVRGIEKENE